MAEKTGMKKVSILGCGWLGKPLAQALIAEGMDVSGSTTQESKFTELQYLGIKPFLINLSSPDNSSLQTFLSTDVLIISVPPKMKSGGADHYFEQMTTLRETVIKQKTPRLIFISSTSVYPDLNRVVTEADADPIHTMSRAEQLFRDHPVFQTTIIRFGGLVGPDRHPGRFLSGKKDLKGGNAPVNIIHQNDCVEVIRQVIIQDQWDETFNACADEHPSRKEFYAKASEALHLEAPHFIDESETPFKIISSEKIKHVLNYNFLFPDPLRML